MPSPRMLARHSDPNDGDFFPTPPWATRALASALTGQGYRLNHTSALEPMAGAGHIAKTLEEYKMLVSAYDNRRWQGDAFTGNYNIGQRDFMEELPLPGRWHYGITNPAYKDARDVARKLHPMCSRGVALLVRVQFLESLDADKLFAEIGRPTQVMFFQGRISFVKSRVVRNASRYFFHIWVWWDKADPEPRAPVFFPYNTQQMLEKDSDYGS